jgi:hypothetical protein
MTAGRLGAMSLLWCACLCGQLQAGDPRHHHHLAQMASDPDLLEHSAIALASSKDATALARLQVMLASREFLARLDNLADPQQQTYRLRHVMQALEANPVPAVEELCVALADTEEFTAVSIRVNYLLAALAAVRPTSAKAAAVFRRTNHEGFFSINAPLLVANGSPLALEVFEAMIADRLVPAEERIAALRRSLVPHRTDLAVLSSAKRLVDSKLERDVTIAIVESVFDYQPQQWFGRQGMPPTPPAWDAASPDALRYVIEFGRGIERRRDLPASLRRVVRSTLVLLNRIRHEGP